MLFSLQLHHLGPAGSTGVSTQSTFSGRVFNRKDLTRNFVFDDISHKFTGSVATGKTFTLTQDGSDVTGIVTTTSQELVVMMKLLTTV